MCRQKVRYHIICEHNWPFMVTECEKLTNEKEKHLQKQGLWSKLFASKPSCTVIRMHERVFAFCPWCHRARREDYSSDEYGNDIEVSDRKVQVYYQSRFMEEWLDDKPSRGCPAGMPANLRNSFLQLSSSQIMDRQGKHPTEIQNKSMGPDINWDRWSHVRDHILPPMPGPPPSKPLPPTPPGRQHDDVLEQQAPASQGRCSSITNQRIRRKPVPQQQVERPTIHQSRYVDVQADPEPAHPESQSGHDGYPLPLILDYNRELPEMPWLPEPNSPEAPWLPKPDLGRALTTSFARKAGSNGLDPHTPAREVRRGGSDTNRSHENPPELQSTPASEFPDDTEIGDGPDRRAEAISGKHTHIHSVYGDMAYVSPKLEEEINDVEDYWMTGARMSEDEAEAINRAETVPIPPKQKGKGERRSKAARKIRFDDNVRRDTP